MKFLLCHNYYRHPGGESEVFEAELKGLKMMGEEVFVIDRQNASIDQFSMAEKAGMFASAFYSLSTSLELNKIIQNQQPDVAIVQNVFPLISPSVYATLWNANIPIIQAVYNYRLICPSGELFTEGQICERCVSGNTAHAVIHRCYRDSYAESAWYASIIGLHRRLGTFSKKITSFMVPDDFLGRKLIEGGIPPDKVWINPNPFFVNEYQPSSDHHGYFLFVGRLVRQKGILTLLKAIELTRSKVRLVVVGRGELEDRLKALTGSGSLVGRVDWLGPRWGDEVSNLIRGCMAVVIPSEWYDNLPVILCRANAMGKPVIASRINGIPEYVREGVNGYLFSPGDAVELAQVLDRVVEISSFDYERLSAQARTFAENVLDYSNHYRNLMTTIQRITQGGVP